MPKKPTRLAPSCPAVAALSCPACTQVAGKMEEHRSYVRRLRREVQQLAQGQGRCTCLPWHPEPYAPAPLEPDACFRQIWAPGAAGLMLHDAASFFEPTILKVSLPVRKLGAPAPARQVPLPIDRTPPPLSSALCAPCPSAQRRRGQRGGAGGATPGVWGRPGAHGGAAHGGDGSGGRHGAHCRWVLAGLAGQRVRHELGWAG